MELEYSFIYGLLFFAFIAVELYGAFFRKERGDTFSENIWWLQDRIPGLRWIVAAFLAVGVVWLVPHFLAG